MVEDLNAGKVKVLVTTGQFNAGYCNTWEGCCGRHRGKDKARVFDYVDPVGVLENAARARVRGHGGCT